METEKLPPEPVYDDTCSRCDAAAILGIDPATLDKYVRAEKIPHRRLAETSPGRRPHTRFRRSELHRWVEERTVKV